MNKFEEQARALAAYHKAKGTKDIYLYEWKKGISSHWNTRIRLVERAYLEELLKDGYKRRDIRPPVRGSMTVSEYDKRLREDAVEFGYTIHEVDPLEQTISSWDWHKQGAEDESHQDQKSG